MDFFETYLNDFSQIHGVPQRLEVSMGSGSNICGFRNGTNGSHDIQNGRFNAPIHVVSNHIPSLETNHSLLCCIHTIPIP